MAQDTYPSGQVTVELEMSVSSMTTYFNGVTMDDSSIVDYPVDPLDELFGQQQPGMMDFNLFGLNDCASDYFLL